MTKSLFWEKEVILPSLPSPANCRLYAELEHVAMIDKETEKPTLSGIRGPAMWLDGTNEVWFILDKMPPLIDGFGMLLGISPMVDRDEVGDKKFEMAIRPPNKPAYEVGLFRDGVATKLGAGWRKKKAFAVRMHWPLGFGNHSAGIAALLVRPC